MMLRLFSAKLVSFTKISNFLPLVNKFVSSVNNFNLKFGIDKCISLIYNKNSNGPNTDPMRYTTRDITHVGLYIANGDILQTIC